MSPSAPSPSPRSGEAVIAIWKQYLSRLLDQYDRNRGSFIGFLPKLFAFFALLNFGAYWLAITTAYPENAFGADRLNYFLLSFPVGTLGAVFDTASFFITVFIARRALKTTSLASYIAHLSVDVAIAIVATFWVLFVFSFSGWLISLVLDSPEALVDRTTKYGSRFEEALTDPTDGDSLRNIYFGVVMGMSAMLPSLIHLGLFVKAVGRYARRYARVADRN
ncbi:MAG: hypothetical protein ICV77_04225 [Cyanobacteria bacterium Co-bin8]|nr:hypothetical protein [Cyanobacteria bacterium Co-bin8]